MNQSKIFTINSRSGFSIVETLITAGLMAILALAMASLISDQNKSIKVLQEKLLMTQVETQIRNVIISSSFCSCLFNGKTFNTTPGYEAFSTPIASIPSAYTVPAPTCTASGGAMIVPPSGSSLSNSSVRVGGITLTNIVQQGGATSGTYTANLSVAPDPTSVVMQLRPIEIPILFTIDTSTGGPTNRPFLNCGSAVAGNSPIEFLATPITLPFGANNTWTSYTLPASIPAGVSVLLFEVQLVNFWRVGGINVQYNRTNIVPSPATLDLPATTLQMGVSTDNDSQGADYSQKVAPVDPLTRTFIFRYYAWGDGGSAVFKIIGYYR